MTQRRAALAVLASAALAAACGGTGSVGVTIRQVDGSTTVALADAGLSVRSQKTTSFTVIEHVVTAGHTEDVTGTGGYDYTANDGVLHLTTAGQQVTVIVTGTLLYEMLPSGAAGTGGVTTPWISVPVASVVSSAGQSSLAAGDPTQALDQLSSLTGVLAVGGETIRGVDTTHYTGTADPAKSFTSLTPAEQAREKAAFAGISSVPVDIWLDDAGLPRRFSTTLTTTTAAQKVTVTSTYELFDFGRPVTVTIPDADQVTPRQSLTG